jgi:hypothetical protein
MMGATGPMVFVSEAPKKKVSTPPAEKPQRPGANVMKRYLVFTLMKRPNKLERLFLASLFILV